jgi:spore germination cell wall hydrolase CwlJ-like protein
VEKQIVSQKQIQCLATAIYYEAGHEPFIGQVAVARVIVNRITHGFASTPCNVVYQATSIKDDAGQIVSRLCQFSWACNDVIKPRNNPRYNQAVDIAKSVLEEDKWNDVIPDNVLFFHNNTVNPKWIYKKFTTIGNHIFYAKGSEKNQTTLTTSK